MITDDLNTAVKAGVYNFGAVTNRPNTAGESDFPRCLYPWYQYCHSGVLLASKPEVVVAGYR